MTLVRHAKQLAAIAAAFAGLSFTVAYGGPNYEPPALSPLDFTPVNSVSPLLNNFNEYLGAIEAELGLGKTLAFPNGVVTLATDEEFYAAVALAVQEDPVNADKIVSAAVQYKPNRVKNIVKAVVALVPAAAPDAVSGASFTAPKRASVAASAAISALIEVPASTDADLGEAAAEAVIEETRALIEKVAKAAIAATKPLVKESVAAQGSAALAVAEALVIAYKTDVAATDSTADLYADDIARGIIGGLNNFEGTDRKALAKAILETLTTGTGTTLAQAVNFAMGALKAAKTDLAAGDLNGYDQVLVGLQEAAALSSLADLDDAIAAGAKVQKALRNAASGSTLDDLKLIFQSNLDATVGDDEVEHIGAYVSGAVQALKSRAGNITDWALTDPDSVGVGLDLAAKQSIVAAAVTGHFGATSKVVSAAINAGALGLTPSEAVAAAIPAATNLYSGAAVSAAAKLTDTTAPTGAVSVLNAGISAAVAAGYEGALPDVVRSAVKARKAFDNDLATAAIANVPAGWEEAAAAVILANNPKDKGTVTNRDAIIAATTAKNASIVASVTLAADIAIAAKASSKTIFTDAVNRAYAAPDHARAILFGAGVVNKKLAGPLLGMLLRLKGTGADTDDALRDYAFSLNMKSQAALTLAYEAAVDVIRYEDRIFDIVDHKVLTNPKQAADILGAVVAARPEYAHFAARAAAFRAPSAVGKSARAAIEFAHMQNDKDLAGDDLLLADDPAAVAAISAAVVLGVKDAKLSTTRETAALKAAIAGLVKGSLSFQNAETELKKAGLVSEADFEEATGEGDSIGDPDVSVTTKAKGSAAVLTGAVAQLQVGNLALLNELSKVAITAAAKAAKHHALALAQAAGAAAAAAADKGGSIFTDFLAIAQAIKAVSGISATEPFLENAARFGADQYAADIFGAGARGIRNYDHFSGNNNPVSDIANF